MVGVVRWEREPQLCAVYGSRAALVDSKELPCAVVCQPGVTVPMEWARAQVPIVTVEGEIQPLSDGDVIALQTSGRIDTLFRGNFEHNSLFVTEQCNSYCLMCSQPPRRVDDIEHFLTLNARAVRLMPSEISVLGITGGEPTLLGTRLAELIRICRISLPQTQLEILTNGRRLTDATLAESIAAVADPKVLLTIPLYADNALRHDYIVQAQGAFNETVLGLYNLASLGVRTEVRVVLHKQSIGRLVQLAQFIQKNLPFVEQVAFMGLEVVGLARAHEELLWIEPPDYMDELTRAVEHLAAMGMTSSIYNLPRCLVPPTLWPYLRRSISDWKREYLSACAECRERASCGGLFGTSSRVSRLIHPL